MVRNRQRENNGQLVLFEVRDIQHPEVRHGTFGSVGAAYEYIRSRKLTYTGRSMYTLWVKGSRQAAKYPSPPKENRR